MGSVVGPLMAMLIAGIAFLSLQKSRSVGAPIGIGSMFAIAVLIYGCYPLAIYLALDGYYTPFNDWRLFSDQPMPAEVGRIAWYYTAYFVSFIAGYVLMSRRNQASGPVTVEVDSLVFHALIVVFLLCRMTILLADVLLAQESHDYLDTYLRYRHLPLVVQQLIGHLQGITSVLSLALMAALCRRWHRTKWIVLTWLALECAGVVLGFGGRNQLVLLSLAALAARHFLYRPVSTRSLVLGGIPFLIGFLVIGVLRQFGSADAVALGVDALTSSSEFEALFANAYDVWRLIEIGEIDRQSMLGVVYAGDLVSLIPQQLVPFEKANLQTWYMETYHSELAERGGGLAFGAVAEALVGAGWPDLVLRGVLVGAVLGWFDRMVYGLEGSFWRFVLYLWLLCSCYLIFRATTFALLPVFFYRFLPAMLCVMFVAHLFRATVGQRTEALVR